jgi:hypothetical protein
MFKVKTLVMGVKVLVAGSSEVIIFEKRKS